MSSPSLSGSRRHILPPSLAAGLRRLVWQGAGLALIGTAAAGWASLLTWSIDDPSLNHLTGKPPSNLLGTDGAAIADLLFQSFGLAAPFLLLPLAAWGWRLMIGLLPQRPRLALTLWPLGPLLLAISLSPLPAPESWPLVHGLGGIGGDVFTMFLRPLSALLPDLMASILVSAAALWAGLWLVLSACGLRFADLGILLPRSWRKGTGGPLGALAGAVMAPFRSDSRSPRRVAEGGAQEFWMRKRWRRDDDEEPPPDGEWEEPEEDGAHGEDERFTALDSAGPERGDREEDSPWPWRGFAERVPALDERIEPSFGPVRLDDEAGPASDMDGAAPEADAVPNYRIRRETAQTAAERGHGNGASHPPVALRPPVFTMPPLVLLARPPALRPKAGLSNQALAERARTLEGVLKDFGVNGDITDVHPGPVITLYELKPARGTKSSRVIGLADDIARSMSAVSTRVSVIAGRDAIGIELPNEQRETVYLREILEAPEFQKTDARLALALGKTIGGAPVIVDLARMPHLLIAGTTGSGKSVGINTMILSLIYRLNPDQCKFIMIDPKMLELSVYDAIPHLLTPVVTDPRKAITALKWTVAEMTRRYELMCKLGVRNIQNFNQKAAEAAAKGEALRRTVHTGFDAETGDAVYEDEEFAPEPMPYIVVVIDEMADLMMVAGKDIEFAVQRLSQMARAAGIHLIMATQRPSVDVITGTIKANFPSRISFQVTSKIDSRTILGEQGAEHLLGAGDMLYMATGGRVIRAHGPFVSDAEVEKIVAHLKRQGTPHYLAEVIEEDGDASGADAVTAANGQNGSGDLYDQAVDIVLSERKPTTSYLQRRLGIGYNRAASLIERMEKDGLISAPNRSGKREVLVEVGN